MEAERNALMLEPAPSVAQTSGRVVLLSLPVDHVQTARGTVTLYRPSDPHADRILPLALDTHGRQSVPLTGVLEGRWVLQVRWSAGGRTYYLERPVDAR
jgi:nitrogen fixation protein FixH